MIKPMYTRIVTTADKYTEAECMTNSGVIDSTKLNKIKIMQRIVAVGDSVRVAKVGDLIELNFFAYAKKKFAQGSIKEDMQEHHNQIVSYEIPTIDLNHVTYLMVDERDINYIVTEFEETEVEINTSGIVTADAALLDVINSLPNSGNNFSSGLIL